MVESQNRAILGFKSAGENSLQSAAAKFINQRGLRIIDRGPMRSNGFPAYFAVADAQTEKGQLVRVMVYFVEYRGSVYYFIGYTSPQAFSVFRSVFLQTMEGFSQIQDSRILNREPVRVGLESVSRPARVTDLIPRPLPAPFKPEDVTILNELEPNAEVPPGSILKIPRSR
jgi:predicted Zn-dependent protease